MNDKPRIFEYLRQISEKTTKHKYDKHAAKVASGYQLTQWLSLDQTISNIVHEINKIQFTSGLPNDIIYKYYFHTVPKRKRWLQWVKKDPVPKAREVELQRLIDERGISKREAEYIYFLLERINNNGNDIPF